MFFLTFEYNEIAIGNFHILQSRCKHKKIQKSYQLIASSHVNLILVTAVLSFNKVVSITLNSISLLRRLRLKQYSPL